MGDDDMFSSDLSDDQLRMRLGHMSNTPCQVYPFWILLFDTQITIMYSSTKTHFIQYVIFEKEKKKLLVSDFLAQREEGEREI